MAAAAPISLLRPPSYADNPQGRRYSNAEKEAAYTAWKTLYGRSRRKTSQALAISPSTLARWYEDDAWEARADREDAEESAAARASMTARVLPLLDKGIARLEKIIDDDAATATAVVKAVELVANLAGVGPACRNGVPLAPPPPDPSATGTVRLSTLRALTPDQLAHYRETGHLPQYPSPSA